MWQLQPGELSRAAIDGANLPPTPPADARDAMLLGTYVNFDDLRDGQLADGTFVNKAS